MSWIDTACNIMSGNTQNNNNNCNNNNSCSTNNVNNSNNNSNNDNNNGNNNSNCGKNSNNCNNNNDNNNNDNNNNDCNSNNNKDKDIALELLTMSKSDITALSSVITEISNPQLRELLGSQLTNSLNKHYKLSDIAMNKQWYNAFAAPQQQLQQDIEQLQNK